MATLETTQDLLKDALARADELTDGNSDFHQDVLKYLNRGYRALWMGGNEFVPDQNVDWWWLRETGVLTLEPLIELGTVDVTANSAAITLSSAPTASVAGWFFKVEGHPDVFTIAAHTAADTAATLDSVYTGDSATGASFKLLKLDYDLASDCMKLLSPMRTDRDTTLVIKGMDVDEMMQMYPVTRVQKGIPERFGRVDEDTVRFSHYQDELVRVVYPYLARPADLEDSPSSVPLVPVQYRYVLADMALFYLLHDKEDSRQENIGLQAKSVIQAMGKENRNQWAKVSNLGRIFTRPRSGERYRNVLRTESGVIIG